MIRRVDQEGESAAKCLRVHLTSSWHQMSRNIENATHKSRVLHQPPQLRRVVSMDLEAWKDYGGFAAKNEKLDDAP